MSVNTAKLCQQTKMTRLHAMVFVIRCSTVARNIRRRLVAIADCPRTKLQLSVASRSKEMLAARASGSPP
jgi:hypothetical protein